MATAAILPSRTLTPVERVGIYHGMYLLRMQEALATDYPALKHFLAVKRQELATYETHVHPWERETYLEII